MEAYIWASGSRGRVHTREGDVEAGEQSRKHEGLISNMERREQTVNS